jgi:hypothetical protein
MATIRHRVIGIVIVGVTSIATGGCVAGHHHSSSSHSSQHANDNPATTSSPAETRSVDPHDLPTATHQPGSGSGSHHPRRVASPPPAQKPSHAAGRKTLRGLKSSIPHPLRRTTATDTALAFVINGENWDTRIDKRPNDASRRAAKLATPAFRHTMTAHQPQAAPGHAWNQLQAHHGYTTVTVQKGGLGPPPADNHHRAIRAVTIANQTMHGRHHWTKPGPDTGQVYIITLRRGSGGDWSVANFNIQ